MLSSFPNQTLSPPNPSLKSDKFPVAKNVIRDKQPIAETPLIRPEPAPFSARISWSAFGLSIWMSGLLSLIAIGVIRYLRFASQLGGFQEAPLEWQSAWRRLLLQQGIKTPIPLVVTDELGPALCLLPSGYRLVVPESLWSELSLSEQNSILRHELSHYQRGDIWTVLVARCVMVLHWFNPLAWWATARFEAQAEYLCDAVAAGDDPTTFAETLIRLGTTSRIGLFTAQSLQTGSLVVRVRNDC